MGRSSCCSHACAQILASYDMARFAGFNSTPFSAKALPHSSCRRTEDPRRRNVSRLDLLPLWMSGIQAKRVKPELQEKLARYQREAASVLWHAFKPQILVEETAVELCSG